MAAPQPAPPKLNSSRATAPSSWAQAYVGLPYIMGVGECSHRATLVWRQVFGVDVEAQPAFGDMNAAQSLLRAELEKPSWASVLVPLEGDAVVMWKSCRLAHVGVWVAPGHVLHCTRAEGMVLTPEERLTEQGFRIFGFFRHHTAWTAA